MNFLKVLVICTATVMFAGGCSISDEKDMTKSEVRTQLKIESKEEVGTPSMDRETEKVKTPGALKPELSPPISSTQSGNSQEYKNKIVVIDPGHANRSNTEKEALAPGSNEMKIKDGGGAVGVSTRTPEYAINMKVALKLKEILEKDGLTVVMTKSENSVSIGNVDRANVGNSANANLVIRIHCDSADNSTIKGASMLIPSNSGATEGIYEESKRCGEVVLNNLVEGVRMKSRGIIERKDLTGFNWSKVPVILVEMGFLSNKEEDKLLSSESYQQKLAAALGKGIVEALK